MESFLVIDGSSMLTSSYYGTLPKSVMYAKTPEEKESHYGEIMHTKDGTYTNAIYVMLKTVLKLIKTKKPDYIAIVFDKTRNTFRRTMFPDYKAQRSESPEPLKSQFVLMEEILEKIGITVLISVRFEADDLAGSVIEKFKNTDGLTLYFMTKDHDYYQLADRNVRGWMVQSTAEKAEEIWERHNIYGIPYSDLGLPDKVVEFTPQTVYDETGVVPEQIPDLKGIVGDTSDNIPGVKGVSSAAVPLLQEYGSIEGIYEAIDSCEGDAKAEKALSEFWKDSLKISRSPLKALKEHRDMAYLSKELATIIKTAPVPEDIDGYKTKIYKKELMEVLEKYEFNSLLSKI